MKLGVAEQFVMSSATVLVVMPGNENKATLRFALVVAQVVYPAAQGLAPPSIISMPVVAQAN